MQLIPFSHSLSTSTSILSEAKKAGLPETPMSQDILRVRNFHTFGDGNTDFISKRDKLLDILDRNIFDCVVRSSLDISPPSLDATDSFDDSNPKSLEDSFIAEVRSKPRDSIGSIRLRPCSSDNFDHWTVPLCKRHRVTKLLVRAQSAPSIYLAANISPNPTTEIEAPLLSFDKMLDGGTESSIHLGTKTTGREHFNAAFGQDVFFVATEGVYYVLSLYFRDVLIKR